MGQTKRPTKVLRKRAQAAGGRCIEKHPHSEQWQFKDGAVLTHRYRDADKQLPHLLKWIDERYGRPPQPQRHGVKRAGQPVMDITKLEVTRHARQRFAQMVPDREGVDLVMTLQAPLKVLYSLEHGSWVWVGSRYAIPVQEVDGRLVVTTILWATTELWAEHPREKVGAR